MGFWCLLCFLYVKCKCKTGLIYTRTHIQVFSKHAPSIAKLRMHKNTNKRTKQNLHRRASVARFSLWSLLTVCTFVCPYVCMALCLGSGEAQLPQLSTLALALKSDGPLLPGRPWTPCSPAHCSLGPRTLQMIYYPYRERERESAQPQPLLTSLSILLPFISLHSLNPACQPHYFLSLSKRKIHFQSSILPLHLIVDSPFFYWNFSFLSLLLIPLFFWSVATREHKDCVLLVMFFLIPLLFCFSLCCEVRTSVRCSICNSQSTKAVSSCLCLCHTNRHQILSD